MQRQGERDFECSARQFANKLKSLSVVIEIPLPLVNRGLFFLSYQHGHTFTLEGKRQDEGGFEVDYLKGKRKRQTGRVPLAPSLRRRSFPSPISPEQTTNA